MREGKRICIISTKLILNLEICMQYTTNLQITILLENKYSGVVAHQVIFFFPDKDTIYLQLGHLCKS